MPFPCRFLEAETCILLLFIIRIRFLFVLFVLFNFRFSNDLSHWVNLLKHTTANTFKSSFFFFFSNLSYLHLVWHIASYKHNIHVYFYLLANIKVTIGESVFSHFTLSFWPPYTFYSNYSEAVLIWLVIPYSSETINDTSFWCYQSFNLFWRFRTTGCTVA